MDQKRSKKIFILLVILFILALLFIAYDFARKTTFPGGNKPTKTEKAGQDTNS